MGLVRRVSGPWWRVQGPPESESAAAQLARGWEEWRAEADEYVERGDYVIVLASYHGRGKGSGVEIHQEGAHVFKLRDGKVVRLEVFASRERAMEAVSGH